MDSILGYVEPLVSDPGSKVAVKVHCSNDLYNSQLVRLGPGLAYEIGPPVCHTSVGDITSHPGRRQISSPGSYILVKDWANVELASRHVLCFSFWFQSTATQGCSHPETLFASLNEGEYTGLACKITSDRQIEILYGTGKSIGAFATNLEVRPGIWYNISITIQNLQHLRTLDVSLRDAPVSLGDKGSDQSVSEIVTDSLIIASQQPLLICNQQHQPRAKPLANANLCFNGKMSSFAVHELSSPEIDDYLLRLDFSLDIRSEHVRDISRNGLHGLLVNAPTRAVTDQCWDGRHLDHSAENATGYGAIAFHDDDLDDAGWETDFETQLASHLPSGAYAFHIKDCKTEDYAVFFISPSASSKNKTVIILPTFTYLAYGNERLYDASRAVNIASASSVDIGTSAHRRVLEERNDVGISLYDSHSDGSGAVYSSAKRPLVTMRPNYCHWGTGGPREFSADLFLIGFLDRKLGSGNYDVITDHYISCSQAKDALLRYRTVLSGSHPEYVSFDILEKYYSFLESGGNFLYLGGNGYYWVTAHDPDRSHRIEVRRGGVGCASFRLPPGERVHSLTGEPGGLWRERGRAPNKLTGVGSVACGFGPGVPYHIVVPDRQDRKVAFLFDGISPGDLLIGDFCLLGGGASGDEIDRLDFNLGTSRTTITIASSRGSNGEGGHSDEYGIFNEEKMFPMTNTTGSTSSEIRSDLTINFNSAGGLQFAVGSINWAMSMAYNNYDNQCTTIVLNVMKHCNG